MDTPIVATTHKFYYLKHTMRPLISTDPPFLFYELRTTLHYISVMLTVPLASHFTIRIYFVLRRVPMQFDGKKRKNVSIDLSICLSICRSIYLATHVTMDLVANLRKNHIFIDAVKTEFKWGAVDGNSNSLQLGERRVRFNIGGKDVGPGSPD